MEHTNAKEHELRLISQNWPQKLFIGRGNYENIKTLAISEGVRPEFWEEWAEEHITVVEHAEIVDQVFSVGPNEMFGRT